MDVLYIGTDEICLVNSSFSKVYYHAEKYDINYDRILKLISNKKLLIFVNSFFTSSEHQAFTRGITKAEIRSKINERFAKDDVVFATYNKLFPSGIGQEHINDVVITVVKAHDSEQHIRKILNRCLETDMDLSQIYSFDQAVNTIGLSYSFLNNTININVVMVNEDAMIMVSNMTQFMFGRFIKKKEGEDIMITISRMLANTIKYIRTTYSFLKNEIKITIMSQQAIDIVNIQKSDSIFDSLQFTTKLLTMPSLKIANQIGSIANEMQLLKLSLSNVNKINNLTNNQLNIQIKAHKFIKFFLLFTILVMIASVSYIFFKISTGVKLTTDDVKISKQYDDIEKKISKKEQDLAKLDRDIYAIIADDVRNNIADNSHIDILKDIANVFKKHREFILAEGYKFNCSDCLSKVRRKNTIYIDIALYNVNLSIKFAITKLANLEKDIKLLLGKKYNHVSITFNEITKNKRVAKFEDVRDVMKIEFWND